MGASPHLTRIFGERIGHLSRYGRRDMLRRELNRIAGVLRPRSEAEQFRRSFFAAGGTAEDWGAYIAPMLGAEDAESASGSVPDDGEPGLQGNGLWQEPTGALAASGHAGNAEGPGSASDVEADLWAQHPCERVQASPQCVLSKCRISGRVLAVKVEGVFGAGEHGGLRLTQELRAAADAGVSAVLLDLSGVSGLRFDSPGTLAACQLSLEAAGVRLVLVLPDGAAAGLLEVSGIRSRTSCFEDANSALQYVMEHEARAASG